MQDAGVSNLRFFDLRFFDLSLNPECLFSIQTPHPPLCISQHKWRTDIGQKKGLIDRPSLEIESRHTCWGQRKELGSDPAVIYLNKRGNGQNLISTTGQAEVIANYFFKTWINRLNPSILRHG
jgi:hypothetical protein